MLTDYRGAITGHTTCVLRSVINLDDFLFDEEDDDEEDDVG
jgi:hypothetical protein